MDHWSMTTGQSKLSHILFEFDASALWHTNQFSTRLCLWGTPEIFCSVLELAIGTPIQMTFISSHESKVNNRTVSNRLFRLPYILTIRTDRKVVGQLGIHAAAANFAKIGDQRTAATELCIVRFRFCSSALYLSWYSRGLTASSDAAGASFAKMRDQRTAATERCASQIETCKSANLELET